MRNNPLTSTRNSSGNRQVPAWHAGFLRLIPVIRQHARKRSNLAFSPPPPPGPSGTADELAAARAVAMFSPPPRNGGRGSRSKG